MKLVKFDHFPCFMDVSKTIWVSNIKNIFCISTYKNLSLIERFNFDENDIPVEYIIIRDLVFIKTKKYVYLFQIYQNIKKRFQKEDMEFCCLNINIDRIILYKNNFLYVYDLYGIEKIYFPAKNKKIKYITIYEIQTKYNLISLHEISNELRNFSFVEKYLIKKVGKDVFGEIKKYLKYNWF